MKLLKLLKKIVSCTLTVFVLNVALAGLTIADEITLKLWSRVDRSGPLRAGNILAAADLLNKQFKAAGIDTVVKVDVFENNARGYDPDALQLLKAFAAGKGPDFYVLAHEWLGEFANAGYAMNLERHIKANPEYYSDVVPVLWDSVKFKGQRYAIPQDTEVRGFFYRKDHLRKIGKSEAFIEGLGDRIAKGEFTIYDYSRLAKEVVDAGAAKVGILHRPSKGPDYMMPFFSFDAQLYDSASGKLVLDKKAMLETIKWYDFNVKSGVTNKSNFSGWNWDTVQANWDQGKAFSFFYGIWDVGRQIRAGAPDTGEAYFKNIGFVPFPHSKKGMQPVGLSHPIAYAVVPDSPHKELAATLIGIATTSYFNVQHAVGSFHIGVNNGSAAWPAYANAWALAAATPMLQYAQFMPNHTSFGRYHALVFQALQGVETGRLTPARAVEFLEDEMQDQFGDQLIVR